MRVHFLRNSSFRWCLILLHRRDTDQPTVGIRLLVDVIGKGIRILKPATPSFFFSLFFRFVIWTSGRVKKKGKFIASTCKRNKMFVRSTVHTGARLSLRLLSLHAGRILV